MEFAVNYRSNGDRLAVIDHDSEVSYRELGSLVGRLQLEIAGWPRGLTFLFCKNSLSCVALYLALLGARRPVALLDPGLRPELKDALLSTYRPECIVAPIGVFGAIPNGFEPRTICSVPNLQAFTTSACAEVPHEQLAVLLSTSGTTGSPKMVRLSRANISANAASIAEYLALGPAERPIASLPLHYSYGLSVLNSHLLAGATVVLSEESVIQPKFWEQFNARRCTSISAVPYLYQMLERIGFTDMELPSLRTMTQAGGRLDSPIIQKYATHLQKRGGAFYVMYGQTEATARMTFLPPEHLSAKLGSVGIAIPGGRIEILGAAGTGPECSGEVVYHGPNVMLGYAQNRSELARGDELKGKLATGDLGYLDSDGYLYLTGRSKRIAKVFGLRINLDEVEARLGGAVPAAVVAGVEKLVIFCEAGDEQSFKSTRAELSAAFRLNPSTFEFRLLEILPKHSNGKVNYDLLGKQA